MGEAAISGLVDGGRARLNFRLDKDGYFNGEGDALLPFYDGKYTTVYTQLGARSMYDSDDTRWIGNFGLGQRWFPFAEGDDPRSGTYDAGNLMLGYNAFFDYDFTRDHQRGGVGIEAQYDWLRLASNYYFPLSGWKGSEDFDSRFVEERAAEGWDVRAKGYLPFYRNLAVTGAYSQWYGDHVGMFGVDRLEKDPKVWSYGLEYTPIPLVSGFVTQKSTERGRSDTEFGLNFTYHFGMSWEDQTSHSRVAELRTVGGSRHEFVDRENRIILEYKAKNSYYIEFLRGESSGNTFVFRIRNGFDEYKAGQTVRVTASGVTLAEVPAAPVKKSFLASIGGAIVDFFSVSTAHAADFSQTYTTDGQGKFRVTVTSPVSGPVTLVVQAGNNTQGFTVNVSGGGGSGLVAGTNTLLNTQQTTLTLTGPANSAVTWTVVSGPGALSGEQSTTDASGRATATLTANATGAGSILVRATVDGTSYEVTVTIGVSYSLSFGNVSGVGGNFTSDQTANIPVTLMQNGVAYTTPTQVIWSVVSANNSANLAVTAANQNLATGLAWGSSATSSPGTALATTTTSNTDGSGVASVQLTDILGERTITVRASVTHDGQTVTADQAVTFGTGPIAVFKAPLGGTYRWAENSPLSNTSNSLVSNFPAANACGTTLTAIQLRALSDSYHAETKLPSQAQLKAVAQGSGNGAWVAAGWPAGLYWTGEVGGGGGIAFIVDDNGYENPHPVYDAFPVVCLR